MAETAGMVQRLMIVPEAATACVWIGPTPANTELLFVLRDDSSVTAGDPTQNAIVDALTGAVVGRREVVAIHDATSARITSLRVGPG